MKAGKEHREPLSEPALAVLRAMRTTKQSPYVFPRENALPVRGATVWRLAKRLGGIGVHGFRSSFRDWAAERTPSTEAAEMALAHAIPDAVEKAYRRGDLFEKRRKLMDAWAAYCAKVETDAGKVVPLAPCANTAIASPKARGRPAVAHFPPSSACPAPPPSWDGGDGGDGVTHTENGDDAAPKERV